MSSAITQKFKLAIIAPTCFYYQADLFRELAEHPRLDLRVYFCSPEAIHGRDVLRQFNTDTRWGAEGDLLWGYESKFLRNYSPSPSYLKWPFGLMNFGVWQEIQNERPDAVVLMSWMNPTWWLAVIACSWFKIPFFYMTDSNVQAEPLKSRFVSWLKRFALGKILFPKVSGFLCAGEANRELYMHYGVPEQKLIPFAFSWGYDRFFQAAKTLKHEKSNFRSELGIPQSSRVILYCGRLSPEKTPETLLKAYKLLSVPGTTLIFVGDGKLRPSLEKYVTDNNLDSVIFFGFQTRDAISKFYALADMLVLPSLREATGGVINEAMCFGLPVIISDQVGYGRDLVSDGYNGFTFPVGDETSLAAAIERLLSLTSDERLEMGKRSTQIMEEWLARDLPGTLVKYLDNLNRYQDHGAHH